jgi:hypothetical protein
MEGLRNNALTEARGFKGFADKVLLPDLIVGALLVDLTGLGDLWRTEAPKPGDGNFEVAFDAGPMLCR